MNNKIDKSTTNMCGNEKTIIVEIIKVLITAIMIITVIIIIDNSNL